MVFYPKDLEAMSPSALIKITNLGHSIYREMIRVYSGHDKIDPESCLDIDEEHFPEISGLDSIELNLLMQSFSGMGYRVRSQNRLNSYRIHIKPIRIEDAFHDTGTINACINIGMEYLNDFSGLTEEELRKKPRFGGKGKTADRVKEAMCLYGIEFKDE